MPELTTQFNVHCSLLVTFYPIAVLCSFIKLKSILIHIFVDPWNMNSVRAVTGRAIPYSLSHLRMQYTLLDD